MNYQETEQENYKMFRYWNNGWKFKFRGEIFSPFHTQENGFPYIHSLVNSHRDDSNFAASGVFHLFSACNYSGGRKNERI